MDGCVGGAGTDKIVSEEIMPDPRVEGCVESRQKV